MKGDKGENWHLRDKIDNHRPNPPRWQKSYNPVRRVTATLSIVPPPLVAFTAVSHLLQLPTLPSPHLIHHRWSGSGLLKQMGRHR